MNSTMLNTIVTPDKDAVVSEVHISAPADAIFRALTQVDLLMRWWDGSDGPCRVKVWEFEPRVGGRHRHVAYDPTGQSGRSTGRSSNSIPLALLLIHGLRTSILLPDTPRSCVGN